MQVRYTYEYIMTSLHASNYNAENVCDNSLDNLLF